MTAYYNENDPFHAARLRELIKAGHIAPGDVDERSIEDVAPRDLVGYAQCHWFAGLGGWSRALRLAGWPDDRPVWTGSCPCQPFSAAGKRAGFADERHLWPAWHWLIQQRRPGCILGEQVAGGDADAWLDLVSTDLEALGYACGPVVFPAAGVGAPIGRHRIWFVACADSEGSWIPWERRPHTGRRSQTIQLGGPPGQRCREAGRGHGRSEEWAGDAGPVGGVVESACGGTPAAQQSGRRDGPVGGGDVGGMDGSAGPRPERTGEGSAGERRVSQLPGGGRGPVNGFWADAGWVWCRPESDGKPWTLRPVEPGSFPMAARLPRGLGNLSARVRRMAALAGLDGPSLKAAKAYRVGSIRGYGNAIVAEAAAAFIRAANETINSRGQHGTHA